MIQLHLLGATDLRRDGADLRAAVSQPKRLALLAYLASASPRGFHSRDTLLALFWPELDQERARSALRQALHYLRRALGDEVVISRGDREVGIDSSALWCDAAAFDDAVATGRHQAALDLYRGDLLPGFFIEDAPDAERWLEDERARRRRLAVEAAWALAAREESAAELRSAALWARRAAALEPLDEGSLRRLMEVLDRAGEPAAALEAFAEFARLLEREYGVGPSAATIDLLKGIQGRQRPVELVRPPAVEPDRIAAGAFAATASAPRVAARAIAADPGAEPASRRHRVSRGLLASTVLLVVVGAAITIAARRREVPARGEQPSIAVLPFENLSGDSARAYFSDGLAEELLNVLSQIPDLRVAARTSSFRFRGNEVPADSIGKLLRVRHLLEGSVREESGRVRITAQLIDTRTGYHVWSRTYDRDVRDVFAVQDEISREIVSSLQVKLGDRAGGGPLVRRETGDPEAYALVLKGSHVLRTSDRESFARAAAFFEQAIRRDPGYGRAYAGLALVLQNQAYRRYIPVEEGYRRAKAVAERALELDPAQIRAHTVLARIAEIHAWDFADAEAHYRLAAELNPAAAPYLAPRAFLLMRLGRADEAIELARRYTEVEPDHAGGFNNLGVLYAFAGRLDRSLDAFHSALELDPQSPSALLGIALTYSYLGRHDDALRAMNQSRHDRPDDQYVLSAAGYVLARMGRRAEAEDALRRLRAQPEASAYLQAVVLAGLGRRDEAFEHLARAVDRREDAAPDLGVDPSLDDLRDDPRMDALLRRAGLPAAAGRRPGSAAPR
jgi:serine/threonine-protein kinase